MSIASPEESHSAPTLSAVAKLAGVSSITVSRVVRLPDLVAPETRGRVEAAMRELGYVPNQLAVALARARTRSIGVLVPTIANSIFADTVQGLSDELEPLGYAVILAEANGTGWSTGCPHRTAQPCRRRRAPRTDPRPPPATAAGSPTSTRPCRRSRCRCPRTGASPTVTT